jgi:hypothetical protein
MWECEMGMQTPPSEAANAATPSSDHFKCPQNIWGRAQADFYLNGDAIQQRSSGAVDRDFRFRNTVAQ